ncbi:hypothetical protein BJX61DRAFT_545117 [Aspergillus egyptiacus]|nr:hypothetical protein BJX61DRAFT_545117 [Aspergillus egyptiacus]
MKFTIPTTLFALVLSSANALSIPRSTDVRTVTFTNEFSGRGQSADIPATGVDVSVKDTYPTLFNPEYRIDSVMITSGVVSGAYCVVHGSSSAGAPVTVLEVNGEKNYAKFPKDVDVVPESLKINCV